MPIYEYYCPVCQAKFEVLRPMSAAGEPGTCPAGHEGALRTLSVFSSVSRAEAGDSFAASTGCACGGACACGRAASA